MAKTSIKMNIKDTVLAEDVFRPSYIMEWSNSPDMTIPVCTEGTNLLTKSISIYDLFETFLTETPLVSEHISLHELYQLFKNWYHDAFSGQRPLPRKALLRYLEKKYKKVDNCIIMDNHIIDIKSGILDSTPI
jgi:hypothetical protein